ncbi:MAG: type II secretion system minor pseudopilin GspK [Pseudomonadota bacterium]
MRRRRSEEGVALLSALLIVSIMAAIAVAMSDVALRSLSRATVSDERGRVSWQITGAEAAGLSAIDDLLLTTEAALSIDNPVFAEPIVFSASGGSISGDLRDASNCFNLNALAAVGEVAEDSSERPPAVLAYIDLLLSLQLSEFEVEALTDALLDWLDADNTPRLSGAEDGYYLSLSPPYRTGGQPMVHISELRAVLGYEPEILEVLLPQVCVRPNSNLGPFNLNTLEEYHTPLLVMLLGNSITLNEAQDLLTRRPFGGWSTPDAFLELDAVGRITPELVRSDLTSITTNFLSFRGVASFGKVSADFETLYEIGDEGTARIVQRNRSPR